MDNSEVPGSDPVDITTDFNSACKELGPGQLLKVPSFSLSDATHALELMDPKMDAGIFGYQEGFSNVQNSDVELSCSEFLATFDATFAQISSWLCFQHLDLTVFTNVLLHKPDLINDEFLKIVFSSFGHLVASFMTYIYWANVRDEEDISFASCNHIHEYDSEIIFGSLSKTFNELDDEIESRWPDLKENKKIVGAIKTRLNFLLELFQLFRHSLPPLNPAFDGIFIPNIKASQLSLGNILIILKRVIETIHLGEQPPSSSPDGDYSWLDSFNPHINLRNMAAGFPKNPIILSRYDGYRYLQERLMIVSDMLAAIPHSIQSLESLMTFFRCFGTNTSCVLTRSIAQLIVMPNDSNICGSHQLNEIIFTSFFHPNESLIPNIPEVHSNIDTYISSCTQIFGPIFQIYGRNEARQRERFSEYFEELSLLFDESKNLESYINSALVDSSSSEFPCSNQIFISPNVFHHILELGRYNLELGFLLNLFVPYEFCYIYWFYGEVITKNLMNVYERKYHEAILSFGRTSPNFNDMKQKKMRQMKLKAENQLNNYTGYIVRKMIRYRVENSVSVSLFNFLAGLISIDKLIPPNGEKLRYENRMRFIKPVSNLYYSYDEYLNRTGLYRHDVSPLHYFSKAIEGFEKTLEHLKNIDSADIEPYRYLITSCKRNIVITKLLATTDLKKDVSFEFPTSERSIFPTLKLI